MNGKREDFAVASQGAGPLTQHQTRALVLLARRAYEVQRKCGLVDEGESFDEWRRAAVADAAPGRAGLTKLTQADFCPVRDWFRRLAGAGGAGRAEDLRAGDEARRAAWALARECGRVADAFEGGEAGAMRYAESILLRQCRGNEPSARDIWRVLYTLRNRAKARRGGAAAKNAKGAKDSGTALRPLRSLRQEGNSAPLRLRVEKTAAAPESRRSASGAPEGDFPAPGARRVFPRVSRAVSGVPGR